MKVAIVGILMLTMLTTGCGKDGDKSYVSPPPDVQLAAKMDGYATKWYCIGKLPHKNEHLVVTLLQKNSDGLKYSLRMENKSISNNKISRVKPFFNANDVIIDQSYNKITIVYSNSKTYRPFLVAYYDSTKLLVINKLPGMNSPKAIVNCLTKEISIIN